MEETRVNLRHLLQDIRDSYNCPIEEAILLELVANSLDSKASKIEIFTRPQEKEIIVIDDGKGMKKNEIRNYHDIAATSKIRGKGIGFAGVGAKLALLISKRVITETKENRDKSFATEWYLARENRAPWRFVSPLGKVKSSHGTAITIKVINTHSPLLSEAFVIKTIESHFTPLLDINFPSTIFKVIYRKGIKFIVNGKEIKLDNDFPVQFFKKIKIFFGKKEKKLAGVGYLLKSEKEFSEEMAGIGISTFGKVIKRGWEWLGVSPRSPLKISGMVEIPSLSEILTTNKSDFLKDTSSLKKYYRARKAVQEALIPVLEELGEGKISFESNLKKLKPLEKEIKTTLRYLLNNFPELTPLVGIRKKSLKERTEYNEIPEIEIVSEQDFQKKRELEKEGGEKKSKKIDGLERVSTLSISFEKNQSLDLARMVKNTILINTEHPAYKKAKETNMEEYHLLLSVAWILSRYLGENKSPQGFISQFLSFWASGQKSLQLFYDV